MVIYFCSLRARMWLKSRCTVTFNEKVVSDTVHLGAVAVKPGEFSLRAFQNAKITLVQAESIADLIHAKSEKTALSASRSLQGAFVHKYLRYKIIY